MKNLGLLLVLAAAVATADDSPQWRGHDRTGVSAEKGLLQKWTSGPKLKWAVDTESEGYAAVSVVGETVYVTGSQPAGDEREGVLYALKASDGSEVWRAGFGGEWSRNYERSRCTPTVDGQHIFTFSSMGVASCFDAADGNVVWQRDVLSEVSGKNVRWGIAESPVVYKGLMICHPGGKDAAVVALDAASGKIRWRSKGVSSQSAYCSPIIGKVGGVDTLVTQTADELLGMDPLTGAVRWRVDHRNKYGVHPNTALLLSGDRIVVSSGYGFGTQLIQVRNSSARIGWHTKPLDSHFQGILYLNGQIVGCGRNGLMGLDPSDGSVKWETSSVRKGALVYADKRLYAYDAKGGDVVLLNVTEKGATEEGRFSVTQGEGQHWAHPVVSGGTLYIRHGSALMAYDVSAK